MGTGLAQLAATHGCRVFLIDINTDLLERAVASIEKRLGREVEKGRISEVRRGAILGRIQTSEAVSGLGDAVDELEEALESLRETLGGTSK